MEAGKDVYCEKPMTHTIDEARRVAETVKKTKQVFTVGVQSTADPRWKMANQMITEGKIGHVMQGQTSYYRNSNERPVAVLPAHQGHDPQDRRLEDVPGDRVRPGPRAAVQPRQVRPVAVLLGLRRRHVHRPVRPPAHPPDHGDGRPLPAPGRRRRRPLPRVRRPRRARRGHGGRRLRRGLPGHHLGHDVQRRPAPRGHPRPHRDDQVRAQARATASRSSSRSSKAGPPLRAPTRARAATSSVPTSPARTPGPSGSTSSSACRSRNPETLCPADLGYAAIATVNLGVQSYREGKALFFNKENGQVVEADSSWAGPLGRAQPAPRQAQPGHRLEGRRHRLAARAARATRSSRATGSTARIPAENA